jgi:hypothetical protein
MHPQSSKLLRTCEQCGLEFLAYSCYVARGGGRYCSPACVADARRGVPRWATAKVSRLCQQCGVEFLAWPSAVESGGGKFCELACWYAYKTSQNDQRAWACVDRSGEHWLWTGARTSFGHGKISLPGKHGGWIPAHRWAWMQGGGAEPQATGRILHTCDIPACLRNDELGTYTVDGIVYERRGHLWLGTPAANAADMRAKGRGAGLITDPSWWAGKKRDGIRGPYIPDAV